MLEETVFTNETIKEQLKDNYNIEVITINRIDRGSANLYEIITDTARYVLKEFQSKYKHEEIQKEIDIINHLKNQGLKVPRYIQCLNGEYQFVFNGKNIILQEFIEGHIIEQNSGNYEQTIESAQNLGLIVKALGTFPYTLPGGSISGWYSENSFNSSIKKYEELMELTPENEIGNRIKDDFNKKIEMISDIKNKLNHEELEKITYKNTHGDYSVMQFIYNENGTINAIIDFVAASYMPITWEIIRSYSYIDRECVNGNFNIDNFINYVKEFNKVVKLNEYDLKYMVHIYLIQILNSTYGYKQYLSDNNRQDLLNFAFLRTNIAKFLYENYKLISNRLLAEIGQ